MELVNESDSLITVSLAVNSQRGPMFLKPHSLVVGLYCFIERQAELKAKILIVLPVDGIQTIMDVIRIVINKGAEHAIPARQNVAIVAVCPWTFEVMMEFVHVRCNDDPTERPIQIYWQANIGMGEVGKKWRNNPIKNIESGRNTNAYDHAKYQELSD